MQPSKYSCLQTFCIQKQGSAESRRPWRSNIFSQSWPAMNEHLKGRDVHPGMFSQTDPNRRLNISCKPIETYISTPLAEVPHYRLQNHLPGAWCWHTDICSVFEELRATLYINSALSHCAPFKTTVIYNGVREIDRCTCPHIRFHNDLDPFQNKLILRLTLPIWWKSMSQIIEDYAVTCVFNCKVQNSVQDRSKINAK